MLRLLTFASGLLVGIVGVRALKATNTPGVLKDAAGRARSGLREAAVSGLSAVEKSSAGLRGKLEGAPPPAAEGDGPQATP